MHWALRACAPSRLGGQAPPVSAPLRITFVVVVDLVVVRDYLEGMHSMGILQGGVEQVLCIRVAVAHKVCRPVRLPHPGCLRVRSVLVDVIAQVEDYVEVFVLGYRPVDREVALLKVRARGEGERHRVQGSAGLRRGLGAPYTADLVASLKAVPVVPGRL